MTDDADHVLEANARFYRAFEAMDLAAMEALWGHDDHVRCIHPGWPLLSGWKAVRASWEGILAGPVEMRFTITGARVEVGGDLAWVTCTENLLSRTDDRVTVTALLATNLFQRQDGRWRLVHHHASHVMGMPGGA